MSTRSFSRGARLIAVLIVLLAVCVAPASASSPAPDEQTPSGGELGARLTVSPQGEILLDGRVLIPASSHSFPVRIYTWLGSPSFSIKYATCLGVDRWTYFVVYELTARGELVQWSVGGWSRAGRCIFPGMQLA